MNSLIEGFKSVGENTWKCIIFLAAILLPFIALMRWVYDLFSFDREYLTYKEFFNDEYESWKEAFEK